MLKIFRFLLYVSGDALVSETENVKVEFPSLGGSNFARWMDKFVWVLN